MNCDPAPVRIQNIAAYRFARLSDLGELRGRLRSTCRALQLKGTILLSAEGINLFVAGTAAAVTELLAHIGQVPGLAGLAVKYSETEHQPFRRMLVRIKKEIIAFGVPGVDPARRTARRVMPKDLRQWLDAGRSVTLLDTRNDYEIRLGTFRNAMPAGIQQFRDFPAAVQRLPPELKRQTVVTFCTGGIRCEKAAAYMEQQGFQDVWQLDGGILKYFEECGAAHYDGDCFVFDQRVGLDPLLHESGAAQCFACQSPLTPAEQEDPRYAPGVSCIYCFRTPQELQVQLHADRRAQLQQRFAQPPGSVPYENLRPLSIPGECDGQTLLAALRMIVKHLPAHFWEAECAHGMLIDSAGNPALAQRVVRAGERYRHRRPQSIEPDVSLNVRWLYEDEALVVLHKPAPLPMHPGGRYNRNTLQYLLEDLYHPQKPRPAHRLDANTSGVLVVARTRHAAGLLQPQFTDGAVNKTYLVRVIGHPAADEFECRTSIADEPGRLGTRAVDLAGLPACTLFRVRQRHADGTSLLEARPLTGRTNQIRIHCAHLGFPVCGDDSYPGAQQSGTTQTHSLVDLPLCLHALQIQFRHPTTSEELQFMAPAPIWAQLT